MKKQFKNRGSIVINSLIISMILLMIILSTLTICINEFYIVKGHENSIKAYYLGESAINEVTSEINNKVHQIIIKYLIKLRKYKTSYILQKNKGPYHPPSFESDLQTNLAPKIPLFNKNVKNPFSSYLHNHSYNVKVQYNVQDNTIDLLSIGIYKGTKKFIHARLCLPRVENNGMDEYNLPKIQITPLKLESYYQTLGQ